MAYCATLLPQLSLDNMLGQVRARGVAKSLSRSVSRPSHPATFLRRQFIYEKCVPFSDGGLAQI
jgi:hypothetical protein